MWRNLNFSNSTVNIYLLTDTYTSIANTAVETNCHPNNCPKAFQRGVQIIIHNHLTLKSWISNKVSKKLSIHEGIQKVFKRCPKHIKNPSVKTRSKFLKMCNNKMFQRQFIWNNRAIQTQFLDGVFYKFPLEIRKEEVELLV